MSRECQLDYEIRPFHPMRDFAAAFGLYEQCLGEKWTLPEEDFGRVLPCDPRTHSNEFWVTVIGQEIVGLIAVHLSKGTGGTSGLPLLMVHPDFRRLGIGTALYKQAMERVRESSSGKLQLGAGGSSYLFPGVPDNCREALAFFAAQGWTYTETAHDLVCDMRTYITPPNILERVAAQDIRFNHGLPEKEQGQEVKKKICTFEQREFPEWAAYFEKAHPLSYLTAIDRNDEVVGTLLLTLPHYQTGKLALWREILGSDMGTIGVVGVAEEWQGRSIGSALVAHSFEILKAFGVGNCHIGWTWLLDFYGRLGAKPWRSFSMAWRDRETW